MSRSTPSLRHILRRIRKRLKDSLRLLRLLILIQATRAAPSVLCLAARAARARDHHTHLVFDLVCLAP